MMRCVMARLACVNVPALPLQVLLRRRPEWKAHPVAVVAEEKAQAPILWVNGRARHQGVRAGMRHAGGLALTGELRAGTVPSAEIARNVAALVRCLHRFSPHVEPSPEEPGVFWLDAGGLNRLYPSLEGWGQRVRDALGRAGFLARVVVGFSHFGTYAVAKLHPGVAVFADADGERRAARQVPLERLGIEPEARDALDQLAVHTLADLLRLPPSGLAQRFGPGLYRLHRLAAGTLADPLQPVAERATPREEIVLEYAESGVTPLLFLIKNRVHFLFSDLAARRESLRTLTLELTLDDGQPLNSAPATVLRTEVRPAAPTRNAVLLLDLVRLRLEGLRLSAGVMGIVLHAEGVPSEVEQLSLFADRPKRDLDAAGQALAQLRAEFGDQAVVHARLKEAHLPEARFAWEPLERLKPPRPAPERSGFLVRRIYAEPRAFPREPRSLDLGELGRALGGAPLRSLHGPHVISGGWWAGTQHRDYYFAETAPGDLLWLYHDRKRERWFVQGRVE